MTETTKEQIAQAYETLLQNFIRWADGQEGVRSAMVIGSRARRDHPADEFSDLDLSIFVEDPALYLGSTEWLDQIGTPWLSFVEPTGDRRHWERRCLFAGGLDVDFAFVPAKVVSEMIATGVPPEVSDIFRRGFRILFDKDNLLSQIDFHAPGVSQALQVEEAAFLAVVNDFWYHSVWTAKHLRRGELWWSKNCCDGHLKELLRRMLEWHAHSGANVQKNTWLRGRFLEEWADPRAVHALKSTFAHYDLDDIWRALLATMDLFGWLSRETAELNGFGYPEDGSTSAIAFVEGLCNRPVRRQAE